MCPSFLSSIIVFCGPESEIETIETENENTFRINSIEFFFFLNNASGVHELHTTHIFMKPFNNSIDFLFVHFIRSFVSDN